MITLEIKINGKLIGMRAATQMVGSLNADGEHAYVIEGDGFVQEYVSHVRENGAVKLVEKMLETMTDDGTRFLKWSPRPMDSELEAKPETPEDELIKACENNRQKRSRAELEARPEVPEVPDHGNARSTATRKIN